MFSPELLARARHRQNMLIITVALMISLLVPLSMLLLIAVVPDDPDRGDADWPVAVLVIAIPVLTMLATLGALVLLRRRGVRWLQPRPALGLSRPARRRVVRALKSGEHLTGEDEAVTLDVAERILRQERVVAGLAVTFGLVAVLELAARNWITAGFSGVLMVAHPAIQRVQARRARRYLRSAGNAPELTR